MKCTFCKSEKIEGSIWNDIRELLLVNHNTKASITLHNIGVYAVCKDHIMSMVTENGEVIIAGYGYPN